MPILKMIKPIRDTKKFNKNQKCWVYSAYGDLTLFVKAKYRGKGRYIMAWLHENDYKGKDIKEIEVTEKFYQFIMGFSSDYLVDFTKNVETIEVDPKDLKNGLCL